MKQKNYLYQSLPATMPIKHLIILAAFALAQLAGAASYTWTNTVGNWSTPTSWNPNTIGSGPLAADTATFGNAGASTSPGTVNNTVDSGFAGTISNLTYSDFEPTGSYVYPGTSIPANKTLAVTNTVLVGGNIESGGNNASFAYFFGGGTLKVTAPNFLIGNGGTANGAFAIMNLSGLTNFIYNNTNGLIGISTNGGPLVSSTRFGGSLILACGSNNITASALNLGTSTSAQGGVGLLTTSPNNFGTEPDGVQNNGGPVNGFNPEVLTLGPGTNIINAKTLNIANQKYGFIVTNSGSGGLRIRGITGADSDANVNITVGNRNVNGGTGQTVGWLMLNGCAVNIKAGTLVLGTHTAGAVAGASADGGSGLLEFDTGTVSANSLLMANNSGNNNGAIQSIASGKIQVGPNGTLLIGAGQLFAMATANGSGPALGFLTISNGLANCQGPIVMGVGSNSIPPSSPGYAQGIIQLIGSGTLNMGPNSYIGSISNPITGLLLDTNSVFSISIPAVSYTNVCVNQLAWPSPDTGLTLSVAAIPAAITNNEVFPFLHFSTMTNVVSYLFPTLTGVTTDYITNGTSGVFTSPNLVLPPGYTGNLSVNGNTIYLTITGGAGPGAGGVQQLLNPFFGLGGTDWTATGSGASIVSTNSTYYPTNTTSCSSDIRNIVALPGAGTNVAKLTGSFVPGGSTNIWSQSLTVFPVSQIVPGAAVLTPGAQVTMGVPTYVAHEDFMSGADSFYYEVDFLDTNNSVIAAYESATLANLNCSSPILDAWNVMALTNQMQVMGGVNTGVVIATVPNAIVRIPPQTATAQLKAVFIQQNATDAGSVYFSGANIGFLQGPVAPAISAITPNLVTLCTNGFLTCTATSTITTISGVQAVVTSTTLGGTTNNTATYIVGSPGLTVTGLGTSSANISLTLATNTIYQSVVVTATDADGLSAASSPANFDTLTPVLVIEGADFNFTNSVAGTAGNWIDTPANGGLALYKGQIGFTNIDENKSQARTNAATIYRTNNTSIDAVAVNPALPNTGVPPSGTEQKFVTAAANGDTTDIEVMVGFNSAGDWVNYTRSFGSNATNSAPAGLYNVWCYLATVGSGQQIDFSQVTSNPAATGQTTNDLGGFSANAFNSFFTYNYVPLVDAFGNRVAVQINGGVNTFKATVRGNPNIAFYMLVPAVPVLTPVFLNVYPNNTTFTPVNSFTFVVGPAQGAAIATNGIGLTINGAPITSGLSFTPYGSGGWTVTYPILSNELYSVVINVTNMSGYTNSYSGSFDTININNYHWMAVDYDFSTNNNTGSGGSVGDGWTGSLFIDNPVPTGDTNAPNAATWQLVTNSYFQSPTGYEPFNDPSGNGALALQGVDINWLTNSTQDPTNIAGGLVISNSIYRLGTNYNLPNILTQGDGVGTQIAGDSFVLPEFTFARTNIFPGTNAADSHISEFNIGYFYAGNWLNYTRTFPTGNFYVLGRLAAGSAFNGCTLSLVTSGVGTSNQTTSVLGSFSDPSPAGYQSYHWITLLDTNGNNVIVQLGGKATLRLTAPTNSSPSGGALNPLFFMLAPAAAPASPFAISASVNGGNIQIFIPTQLGHNYTLYYTGSLPAATWTPVTTIGGDGGVQFVNQPLAGNQGFYRVVAQ